MPGRLGLPRFRSFVREQAAHSQAHMEGLMITACRATGTPCTPARISAACMASSWCNCLRGGRLNRAGEARPEPDLTNFFRQD